VVTSALAQRRALPIPGGKETQAKAEKP